MDKSISFKAIKCDIQEVFLKNTFLMKNQWLILSFFFFVVISNTLILNFSLIVIMLSAFGFQIWQYSDFQKKKNKKEIIFFERKKNERERNLYIFFIAMFFVWIFRESTSWLLFSLVIAIIFFSKYIFYIPSVMLEVDGYSLRIKRGFQQNKIDFTYTNKVRLISHRMIFENVLDKKVEIKDINYLPKIDELKEFLSDNFGREKVVSAANGQPLI